MSTVAFTDVSLDEGDLGLVFIPGIGFRPAEGLTGVSHGDVVNACPIKCHEISYDELPEEVTTYVPACGGEDGFGKWAEKWTPPMLVDTPPWFDPPITTVTYYPPVYETPFVPWTSCCTIPPPCCEVPWTPPETPEIPPVFLGSSLTFGITFIMALLLAKKVSFA